MIWRQREPTLKEILSDSIVIALMEADGVDRHFEPKGRVPEHPFELGRPGKGGMHSRA
jgi:hypothetical protein